jgi:hypothetical protein
MIQRVFRLPLLLIMLSTLAAWPVHAQLRTLPQNAHFGRLGEPQQLPYVQINRRLHKLAPGGVIYDENNRTILQNALPADVRVAYTLDMAGDIARIYILTATEQAQFERKR